MYGRAKGNISIKYVSIIAMLIFPTLCFAETISRDFYKNLFTINESEFRRNIDPDIFIMAIDGKGDIPFEEFGDLYVSLHLFVEKMKNSLVEKENIVGVPVVRNDYVKNLENYYCATANHAFAIRKKNLLENKVKLLNLKLKYLEYEEKRITGQYATDFSEVIAGFKWILDSRTSFGEKVNGIFDAAMSDHRRKVELDDSISSLQKEIDELIDRAKNIASCKLSVLIYRDKNGNYVTPFTLTIGSYEKIVGFYSKNAGFGAVRDKMKNRTQSAPFDDIFKYESY